jgi:hypothetical protein
MCEYFVDKLPSQNVNTNLHSSLNEEARRKDYIQKREDERMLKKFSILKYLLVKYPFNVHCIIYRTLCVHVQATSLSWTSRGGTTTTTTTVTTAVTRPVSTSSSLSQTSYKPGSVFSSIFNSGYK